MKPSKKLGFFLKLISSVVILGIFISFLDLKTLIGAISSANLSYLVLTFGLILFGVLLSSIRLWLLLKKCTIQVPFQTIVLAYHAGTFFNSFLPSSVGGDVVKSSLLAKDFKTLPIFIVISVFERVSGLIALTMIASVSGFFLDTTFPRWLVLSVTTLSFLLIISVFFAPIFTTKVVQFLPDRFKNWQVFDILKNFPVLFFFIATLPVSLIFQLVAIGSVFTVALSLGLDVSLFTLSFVVPLVSILVLLPISFNGLGLREVGFASLLAFAGVPLVESAALSLVLFGVGTVANATGFLSFLFLQFRSNENPQKS